MANTTIPNLPAAVTLDGTEQLEVVQNGTSKRVTADQIAALAENTQGTVTLINTGGALIGGPITTTGTISLPPDAVTNDYLAEMPANTLKANITNGTANPTDVTASQLFDDAFGSAEGSMVYRGVSSWEDLAPGTTGFYLTTTGQLPQWTALEVGPEDILPTGVTPGSYGSASNVGTFTVNSGGQLTAAASVPIAISYTQVTGLGTMATQNANNVAITGGNIDGTIIGSSTPAQAYFSTISGGTWNGSTIAIAYGGTGATTVSGARVNLLPSYAGNNGKVLAVNSGATDIEWISVAGAGTVTSINASGGTTGMTFSGGPITSAGTLTLGGTLAVANGGTGAASAINARINLLPSYTGNALKFLRINAGETDVEWSAESGVGTVTSVDVSGGTTGLTTSGGPITGSGTITLAGTLAIANGGTGSTSTQYCSLTTNVTGTLPIGNGGTGQTSYVNGELLIGNSIGNTLTKATLTAGSGVSITNGNGSITITATGSGGTVTSVDVSGGTTGLTTSGGPIVGSGTITLAGTLAVTNGGTGQTTYTNGELLIGNTTGNTLTKSTLTAGSGVTITNGSGSITISATGSGGTVTSVDVSGGTTGLTTSGGPIIGSGTITLAGTLITSNGGTGVSSWTAGDLPYYAAGTALSKLAIGAANTVMTSTGSAPQWVTSLTGLTGVSSAGLTNTNLTSGRVVYSTTGGAQTDSAGLTFDGTNFATTGTSTGTKFIPTGGTATGNGMYLATTNVVAFSTDGSERLRIGATGFVGINQNSPGSALDVKGTLRLSGSTSGYVGISPAAAAGSTTYTLPSADGTTGQFLSTNGTGTLSWASAGGGAQDFIVQSYGIV